jgi:hypothetical protein
MNQRPSVLGTAVRVLSFRASREELSSLDGRHLAFGLVATWIVGMGRYWDSPDAALLQRLGLGSVIYVFVLSLLLYLIVWPLKPVDWDYRRLLTYVTLTSPPAILYAIPVERYYELSVAQTMNMWFLGVVAIWRVALYATYLVRVPRIGTWGVVVATLLPLTMIVTVLTMLNLERAVFEIMSSMQTPGTASDGAYAVLVLLTILSMTAFLPLLAIYGAVLGMRRWKGKGPSTP